MISTFFSQLAKDPRKKRFLNAAFDYCMTLDKYPYLIVRTDIDTPESCRYLTHILPQEYPVLIFCQDEDELKKY